MSRSKNHSVLLIFRTVVDRFNVRSRNRTVEGLPWQFLSSISDMYCDVTFASWLHANVYNYVYMVLVVACMLTKIYVTNYSAYLVSNFNEC